jgi:hypothetical protein
VHPGKGVYGAGGSEKAGRGMEPRKEERRGQEESPQEGWRGTPTVSSGRKAAVLGATWQASRTPPGSESGACMHRDSLGTWESHLSPGVYPGEGDRATKGPGGTGRLSPGHEPTGDTTNATEAGMGSGSARHAQRPERDMVAVFAAHRTGEGGERRPTGPTGGKATPGITSGWTDRREILGEHQPSPHNSGALRRRPPMIPIGSSRPWPI